MQNDSASLTNPASPETPVIRTLPQLAGHICRYALGEWCSVYLQNARATGLNLDNYFPDEEAMRSRMSQLMLSVEAQQFEQYIADSIAIMFPAGGLEMIERRATEVTKLNYVRKRTLLHFARTFAPDVDALYRLIDEIDDFSFAFEETIQKRSLAIIRKSLAEAEATRKSLENSRALYKEAQRIGKIGNWRLDVSTGLVEWSDEVFRIYGLEPREEPVTIDEVNSYFHPDDFLEVGQLITIALEGDADRYTGIGRILPPGGGVKILEATGHITRDASGAPLSVFGTIQDITAERTLIGELQHTTGLYQRMEAMASIGTWSYDISENKVHWSDELYNIYGIPKTDGPVDYEAARLLTDEPFRTQNSLLIQKCMEDGTPYDTLGYLTLKDGSKKVVRGMGEAVKDAAGKVVRLFGTLQDITAQQALSERLRQNEESLRRAQSIARIGSGVFYVESGRSRWSDELYNIFEVDRGTDLSYETIAALLPPKEWELMELHIRRCVESGIRFDFHARLQMKDDRTKHVRIIGEPRKRAEGLTQEIFCTVQDVTELRAIEQRLRDNQRFSQKITDVTPAVIAVLNVQNGHYKMVSQMAETIFGYSPETIMAGNFEWMTGIVHPEDIGRVLAQNTHAIEQANGGNPDFAEEQIVEFRYRIRHRDGVYRYVQTSAIIFDRDEAGHVLHVLNVTIDISQLMAAEDKLRAANATLQQSNSSLQEFAYIASHDLQEPLRKISTFGTMIEGMEAELPERGRMYIRKMVESAQRMQGMINDILAVSTIAAEKAFEESSLQTLLEEAMLPLDHKIEQTGAAIRIPQPLPAALVVPAQMRQLFQNLISNSLKFVKKDRPPTIDITWQKVQGSDAHLHGLEADGCYIALSVADNGIGFSNEYAGRVFAIFQRLNGKTEYEGSGIGLAICKKIAEHHHGAIKASGLPDAGATFTVYLPCLVDEPVAAGGK